MIGDDFPEFNGSVCDETFSAAGDFLDFVGGWGGGVGVVVWDGVDWCWWLWIYGGGGSGGGVGVLKGRGIGNGEGDGRGGKDGDAAA